MTDRGRLRAIDAVWLELERGGPPVAIGSVSRCDGPAPSIRELRDLVRDRLPLMPRLAERADHHHWVPVGIDLGRHVRRVRLRTSSPADLDAFIGSLMEEPFDPDRPLWQLILVDGIDDGWALVWRLHHSIADGIGALLLAGHVFDTLPTGGPTLPERALDLARDDASPKAARGTVQRLGSTSARVAHGTLHGAATTLAALPHLREAVRTTLPAPPSPLTGPLGSRRRWRSLELPLADVKRVGKAEEGTVNDVVVALVTAGFRNLLLDDGRPLPDGQPVRCLLPVNLRGAADASAQNQLSALLAQLPVWVEDPHERLRAVVHHLDGLKRSRGYLAVPALLDLVDRAVPAVVQEVAVAHLGDALTPWYLDVVATNVPGPQFPLWVLGRQVRSMHPVIPVAAHIRTTIGVLSYDGSLDIGITTATDGGDPGRAADLIADGMAADLETLRRAL